jgi:hypothetical protein
LLTEQQNKCTTQTHLDRAPRALHSQTQTQTQHTALTHSVPPPPAVAACRVYNRERTSAVWQVSIQSTPLVCRRPCSRNFRTNKLAMHPTGQTRRQWHAESQGDPRASVTDRPRIQRRFQGSTIRQESDGSGTWPQRATAPLERRCVGSSSSDVPWWRTRLERMQQQDELHDRCSEAGENRPPVPQPARRWSTPDPPTPHRSYGFGLRRPWTRQHDTQALPEPRSSIRSGLGGASWRNNEANNYWDSGQSRATRGSNDAGEGDSDELTLMSENTGRLSPQRDPRRWRIVSDDDHVRRNVGPHLSRSDDVGFEQQRAVPAWRANRMSRVVEKSGRRIVVPTSQAMPQRLPDSADQVNPVQSIAPASMVDSPIVGRARPMVMHVQVDTESHINCRPNLVRPRGYQVARESVAPVAWEQDRNLDDDDSDTCVNKDSTRQRRTSVLGKRKMKPHPRLTSDDRSAPQVSVVTDAELRGQDVGPSKEATTTEHQGPSWANKFKDSVGNRATGKPRRRRKLCQYPDGCDKSAQGSTMFCKAHGGGKRCQFPDGCGKSARGSTLFCKSHGGGKRCQYPKGCGKSAEGSTLFCVAHGGGKRCQYLDGCDKGAEGSTIFCVAHGGGKRCRYPDGCDKGAKGATSFCIAHGGGRRCTHKSGCRQLVRRRGLCRRHGVEAGLFDN